MVFLKPLTPLFLSTVAMVILVFFALNRGFDWTDEGLYALMADPNQANLSGMLNYDLFFKLIFKISGFDFSLIQLRLVRLISLLGAGYLLGRWMENQFPAVGSRMEWILISCVGLLASYAFLPPTLSYNSIVLVCAVCWITSLFSEKSLIHDSWRVGWVLGVLVYVKLPTAIILGTLSLAVMLVFQFRKGTKPHYFLLLFVPFLILELVFWLVLGENFLMRLSLAIDSISDRQDYSIFHLLKVELVGIFWIGLIFLSWLWVGKGKRIPNSNQQLRIGTAIGLFFVISWLTHINEEWNHVFVLLCSASIGYYLGRNTAYLFSKINIPIWCLLVLPFLLHLGSNVYFLRLAILNSVFWVLALTIVVKINNPKHYLNVKRIIGITVFLLVFYGLWLRPFEHPKPLWCSQTPYQIPGDSKIFLDAELVTGLEEIKPNLSDDQELLSFYRNPGFSFLLGKTLPFFPGFWNQNQLSTFLDKNPTIDQAIFYPYFPMPESIVLKDTIGVWVIREQHIFLLQKTNGTKPINTF